MELACINNGSTSTAVECQTLKRCFRFLPSNLRGGGDDLQQWDRHIRPLATGQTVKGGWLVGWLPSEAWKICQECLYASELRLVQD